MQKRYDIHGASVEVRWDDAALGDSIGEVLQYFGLETAEAAAEASLTFRFVTTEPAPALPAEAAEAAQFDAGLTAWRHKGRLFLKRKASLAVLDPDAGTGVAYVGPLREASDAARQHTLTGLLVLGLFMLLRPRQLYPLHAAVLARGGDGVLLSAPSDSGKSTLAYGLVRAGWSFLSDDSVLLRPGPGGVETLAFRRGFGLDPEAADLFPEISRVKTPQLADEEKWCVAVDALYPAQAAERCVPRVLLLPRIADVPQSHLVPVGKTEAMLAVVSQSALVTLEPRRAAAHLDVVKRLVQQVRSYELIAGHDLKADPSRLSLMLGEVLAEDDVTAVA